MASTSVPFWLIKASLARSQASKASASGRLGCRTRRRFSGLHPRISFSIAENAAMRCSASLIQNASIESVNRMRDES